jgi:hypothetical protein
LQVTATKYRNIDIFSSLLGVLATPKNHFIFTVFICNKRLLGKFFGCEIEIAVPKGHGEIQIDWWASHGSQNICLELRNKTNP